jgi:hypothetical protein
VASDRAGDDSGRTSAVVLALRVPAGPHAVGLPVPVELEVRNAGGDEIWMVGVVDGSEDGVRYPSYRPSVTRGGAVVASPPPPEDPLVGPLREVDFRRLAPGEAFDPTRRDGEAAYLPLSTFANFRPDEPGTYRYELTLSTESPRPEDWLGRFGQEPHQAKVLELVARVPRLTVGAATEVEVVS